MDLKAEKIDSIESTSKVTVDSKMSGLLLKNNLDYKLPPNLSVAQRRVLIQQYFVKTQYASTETASVILNSGELFCVPQTSFMTFTLATTEITDVANRCRLGSSGCLGAFRTSTARSQSGTEISRSENVGLFARDYINWSPSENWRSSFGTVMGLPDPAVPLPTSPGAGTAAQLFSLGKDTKGETVTGYAPGVRIDASATEGEKKFIVPLRCIWSIFNTKKLIPAQLLGGMRLEVDFNPGAEAFIWNNDGATDYVIKDMIIHLDTVQLVDRALGALNKIAAADSLESVYTEIDHTRTSTTGTTIALDVRRSVSRAMSAYLKLRDPAVISDRKRDSFAAAPYDITSIQYQLGGLWFPNAPIKSAEEDFVQACRAWDKSGDSYFPQSVSLAKYKGYNGEGITDAAGVAFVNNAGEAISAVQLSRSTVLELAGCPVSNSRVLKVVGSRSAGTVRTADIYLQFIRVCQTGLSGRVKVRE